MRPTRRQLRILAIAGLALSFGTVLVTTIRHSEREGRFLPAPPVPAVTARGPQPKAEDVLAKLKPGMLRTDVEAILGPAKSVESIRNGNGRLSYRATFVFESMHPPLPPLQLEFDATRPGHPLITAKPM